MVRARTVKQRTRMNLMPPEEGWFAPDDGISPGAIAIYGMLLVLIGVAVVEFTGYGPDTVTDLLPN